MLTGLMLVAALVVARGSWSLPVTGDAEARLYDFRATSLIPRVEQDERIALVVYNDDTLIATRKRSPLDRAILARALASLDQMGAKSIGIDMLFDQPQDEDDALVAQLRAMKTPTWIGYAEIGSNAEQIGWSQQQFLDTFIKRVQTVRTRPASIRLVADADNVMRRWTEHKRGLPPMLVSAMAPKHALMGYLGGIRYREPNSEDRPVFPKFPIDTVSDPAVAPLFASQFKGRHILIGGDIVDIDRFDTPMSAYGRPTMIGLEVHANMLAQALDGARLPHLPGPILWVIACLVVIAAMITSLSDLRLWQLIALLLGQAVLFGILPFWLQARGWDTIGLPAIGWAVGWVLAFAATGSAARAVGSQQRRFAQSALGKYLPRTIAAQILADPDQLALHGENRDIYVLFSDLEGFTKLSHAIPPEQVAKIINRYLDIMSDIVLAHGGTIDKFVGDAVVAFWGAPIAQADDGTNAAKAAFAMFQAGETFRHAVTADLPDGAPPMGKTRVGLHWGEATVGNFGGKGRMQYTALGDSMNTASRLESANKALDSGMIASREAVERSGLDWWRPMGRVLLRGRATPVEIFEPAPNFPPSDRDHLRRIMAAVETDKSKALADLAAMVARHPADASLANLLYRLTAQEDGNAYVTG
jgi:adenylate cyclase